MSSAGPEKSSPTVVVIGGGLAGLTAAREILVRMPGAAVTVLDASDRVGGKLRREEIAGHLVDVGAEAMLSMRPEAVDLVAELASPEDVVTPATTAARIWSRGELYPLPRTRIGVPFADSVVTGLLSRGEEERMRSESSAPEVGEDVSVGDYVASRLGDAVVERLVEPMLGGVYAGHARSLSLQATMPAVWGVARGGGSLLEPPVVDPQGGAPRSPFIGLVGGVGRLPELLLSDVERRRGTVESGVIVRGLERRGSGWRVLSGPTTEPRWIEADAVVVAVPPPAAARLLGPVAPDAAGALGEVEVASVGVITLAVPAAEVATWEGSGFLVPPVDGRGIKASTFSSAKWGWLAAEGGRTAYLRASVGRAGETATLQREDGELVEIAAREVAEALGASPLTIIDSHVQRWGGALPQYAVGHVDRVARVRRGVASVDGLEVAGAAYDGVGIPAVIGTGRAAGAATVTHLRGLTSRAGE
ncbi:protoporphyrinogen oxidase [Knoellia subterranea]|uniref:Coproporphyrinogen III oxidase n=1 Tax=Knoellia subterranea KCTC 19937 TaxID=1385521 RepID=A0A0A0JSH8_9MICO|nr:protoporphyrinogen oxidase [Knoellia subterranea]KGN38561.1 protoporphyrinogen oxidase [Knoellia subterranea KCTC 19937]